MTKCDFCRKNVLKPYECKLCEGHFCEEHKFPQKHACGIWIINEEERKLRVDKGDGEFDRQLSVVEDFYSTRAVAHASFFVASIFGLFAILAFMERFTMVSKILVSFAYWAVWSGGLYSFMRFSFYSGRAQAAQRRTTKDAEKLWDVVPENPKGQQTIPSIFEKVRSSRFVKRHDLAMFVIAYAFIGCLVFVAFWLG
jgi:hypothetical protein